MATGSSLVISGCTVVTMDGQRTEHACGHVVVDAGRITAVGAGGGPADAGARIVDGPGCVLTPGLVNTHHHLYQWVTRGLAVDATLFEWLTTLYPVWGWLDEESVSAAATAGLGWLARTGCTTSMDHHYVFPRAGGDLLAAEVEAARAIGLRFMPTRGSMDLGRSAGGLPPDHVVEDLDTILSATAEAVDRYHDPSPDSMLRIGVAHCPASNARLGAGISRVRALWDAGVPVGVGVDGAASNEAGSLLEEARHALLMARARGGPLALSVRDALEIATIGGARVLGWDDQIGTVEVGKIADLALWRVDTLPHADIVDPSRVLSSAASRRWSCCSSAGGRWSSRTAWSSPMRRTWLVARWKPTVGCRSVPGTRECGPEGVGPHHGGGPAEIANS